MFLISIIQVLLVFVLPVYLLYKKIIPFKYRLHVLFFIFLIVIFFIIIEGMTFYDLGIRFDNIDNHIFPYIAFTVLVSVAIIYLSKYVLKREHYIHYWHEKRFHILVFIPLCFLQEFIFRGYLIPKLFDIFNSSIMVVFINSLLFMYIHVIYSRKNLDLLLVFIEGFLLAMIYIFYTNLIFVAIAHSIHNFIAIFFKFFVEEKK
jgi:membrane protease YdiL (CAAX protease family)